MKDAFASTVVAGLVIFGLAGCGGGGGTEAPPPMSPPPWGQLDTAYGVGGTVTLTAPQFDTGSLFTGSRMGVLPDGTAYLAGSSALIKLDRSGVPDASFGDSGSVAIASIVRSSLALDETGSVYLISGSEIVKLDSAGRLDAAFGMNGRAALRQGDGYAWARLVRDSSGNLFTVGAKTDINTPFSLTAVAMVDPAGRPVGSFGDSGTSLVALPGGRTGAGSDVAFDSEGSLFIAGQGASPNAQAEPFVLKVGRDGQLAPNFALGGVWIGPACGASDPHIGVDSSDSTIVGVTCSTFIEGSQAYVFKLDARGEVVSEFRNGGLRPGVFESNYMGTPTSLAALLVRPNGEIYAAGQRQGTRPGTLPGCTDVAIAKLNSRGDPMSSVNSTTLVAFEGLPDDMATDVAMDAHGRLYVRRIRISDCPLRKPNIPVVLVSRIGS